MEGKKANWILWKFFIASSINVKHFSISFGTKTYIESFMSYCNRANKLGSLYSKIIFWSLRLSLLEMILKSKKS